jgi:hypothetical protein
MRDAPRCGHQRLHGQSGFAADMDGFDVGNIVNVGELLLEPAAALTLS